MTESVDLSTLQSLILIEHVLQHGPENMVHYCKSNFHIIRTLREFQYLDEMGHDQGVHVRQKAMDITNLLTNPSALRHKRRARSVMDTSFLLSLGNTADIDDEENENIRRRDVRVVRTSSPDQTEESPLPGTQSSSGATRGARESSIPGLHDDGLRPQASSSDTRRAASSPKPLDDFFPKARGRGSISWVYMPRIY